MLAFIVLQDDISMGTIVELKGLVSHTIKSATYIGMIVEIIVQHGIILEEMLSQILEYMVLAILQGQYKNA